MNPKTAFGFSLRGSTHAAATLIAVGFFIGFSNFAHAVLCTDGTFPLSLDLFESCHTAGQDTLPNVQAALDLALEPDVSLSPIGSFCTAGTCGSSEFLASDPGNGFVIDPATLDGSNSFEFTSIPPDTLFITMKQGSDFQVFKVPGPTPFTLTHKLGDSTSHISTFVPEPFAAGWLALLGIMGIAWRRR